MTALFLLLIAPGAGRAAPDPAVACQVVTAKAASTCIKKAASNSDGKAIIYDTPSAHTYSVTVNSNRTGALDARG